MTHIRSLTALGLALMVLLAGAAEGGEYFGIQVVDDVTNRGVPLVELETVNNVRFVTDSAGWVAISDPVLAGRDVFLHVKSHGYEFAKDGFGFRGRALAVRAGESAVLKIKRLNIAERLYRVTGAGIYRDSVLLGKPTPIKEPLLSAQVFGSDSVLTAVYRDRVFWLWGDTNRPGYPLGNFHVPGAFSDLPEKGGLKATVGVNLEYFAGEKGFAKETCRMEGEGPTWIDSLVVESDGTRERLRAHFVKVKPPLSVYAQGFAEFNDAESKFEPRGSITPETVLAPAGHAVRHPEGGVDYFYFASPFPHVRVPVGKFLDASAYEAWTYLKPGSSEKSPEVEREANGKLVLKWKRGTAAVSLETERALRRDGKLRPDEPRLIELRDAESVRTITPHRGSVEWNRHRQRWVMICVEIGGQASMLGEVWYAEARELTGPWSKAVRIATHDRQSFYNPKQHPQFAEDNDRWIFFEGTYTNSFSGNPQQTPWYEYNQMMYRLDVTDPRLRGAQAD